MSCRAIRVFLRPWLLLGYEPVSVTVFLEFNLAEAEPRDPRAVLIRRQTQLDLQEDALPANWWENQALSELHLARFRLLARSDGAELARATTWDMSWFGRGDGQTRIGLIGVEVSPQHRRKGYGRYLVSEVIRWAREHAVALVEVQTSSTNRPALALYQSLGFQADRAVHALPPACPPDGPIGPCLISQETPAEPAPGLA